MRNYFFNYKILFTNKIFKVDNNYFMYPYDLAGGYYLNSSINGLGNQL